MRVAAIITGMTADVTCARHLAGEAPAACLATEGTGGREIIVEFVVQNEP